MPWNLDRRAITSESRKKDLAESMCVVFVALDYQMMVDLLVERSSFMEQDIKRWS